MNYADYRFLQLFCLCALRFAIGWHFLYEGLVKFLDGNWTSYAYLKDAGGFFAPFYHALADNPEWLYWCDQLNIVGLILIGLSLLLGVFVHWSASAGILLLLLYYLSHIPGITTDFLMPVSGNHLWIDNQVIEILALGVIYLFPTSHRVGLARWVGQTY